MLIGTPNGRSFAMRPGEYGIRLPRGRCLSDEHTTFANSIDRFVRHRRDRVHADRVTRRRS